MAAPSITEVADLIAFDFENDARAEFGPIDGVEWWIMFADTKDHTTIYIKKDL